MTPGIQTLIRSHEETWHRHFAAPLNDGDPEAALARTTRPGSAR